MTGAPAAFPWRQVMALALGRCRISPQVFWAMTLPELASALGEARPPGGAVPSQSDLADLMRAFPDRDGRPAMSRNPKE